MHAVIFDPVKGNSPFLTYPDGPRLLNVASRAQARFVLFASTGDLKNPLLSAIAEYIRVRVAEAICRSKPRRGA